MINKIAIIIFLSSTLLFSAESKVVAAISTLKGLVMVKPVGSRKYIPAYKGQMLKSGEWIKTKNGVFVRHWRHGDRVKLNRGKKKVSDLFIDFKLPLFKKSLYPIFENSNREIIWIPGIYVKKQSGTLKDIAMSWEE